MEIPYLAKNSLEPPDLREGPGAQGPLVEGRDEDRNGGNVDADEQIDNENSGSSSNHHYHLLNIYLIIACILIRMI